MQDQSSNSLVDPMGEATIPLLSLVVVGQALPYLHNGIMTMEDEDFSVSRSGRNLSLSLPRCVQKLNLSYVCKTFSSFLLD